jgi:signal transduction histidine kinase/Tfp pilus assembly protein PilN
VTNAPASAPVPLPRPPRRRLSLRRRLQHGLGVIVVCGVLILVLGVTFFVYRTERESWQSRQVEAAHSAAQTVDAFMRQVQDSLTLVSVLDSAYLQDSPQVLQDVLAQIPALLEIIRLDADGQVLVGAYQDNPVLANLFTIPQSNWFLQARAGWPYVGQMQISAENEPYLILAIPAPDGEVVAARLRMNVLWDVVAAIHFGKTGQAYVIDRKGEVVAHSDPEIVLARTIIAGRPEVQSAFQAADHEWHGLYRNFVGASVVGSSAAIPDSDWIIFAEVSQIEAFTTTRYALLILGGGVILAGILLIVFANRLLRREIFEPVERLRDSAERIGQGDLDHRIQVYQMDEVGQVAEAFNEMAGRLHDRERALEEARDQALEASRFKSRLLANVSHDLRTPLNIILGYAEVLEEGMYGEVVGEQRTVIARIVANAKRLLNLINSLLDQAQIEAGRLTLRASEFAPAALLNEVQGIMSTMAQAKGMELTGEIAPDLPAELVGDVQRIQQIMVNLVENAIKFTREGGVHIRLYLPDDARWAIEISDTGSGIPPEAQKRIFEPFRRVDDSPTREQAGVGLGLSIVKQVTTLMGGEVCLSSEIGRGSSFTVLLPLVIKEGDEP